MNIRTYAYILLATLALGLPGCAAPIRPIEPTTGPTTKGPVPADRDDAPRALLVALEHVEGALLEDAWTGDTYTASFLLLESREGRASARFTPEGGALLSAYVEPQGDRRAQQRLVEAWAHRLGQLQGVEWAPR